MDPITYFGLVVIAGLVSAIIGIVGGKIIREIAKRPKGL